MPGAILVQSESWRQEFEPAGKTKPLGMLPLVVVEGAKGTSEAWHKRQLYLAKLSSGGKQAIADKSGYLIHL